MRLGKHTLLPLLAAASLAACNETTGPDDARAPVLIEIEYVNYAWTPQFFGFFVDASGDVSSYNREGAPWDHRDASAITEERLAEKFSLKRTLVTTRDTAELRTVATKVNQVNPGQLTEQKLVCADAGTLTYRAYKYNAGSRTYTPVLLRVEGDLAKRLAQLLEVLDHIASTHGIVLLVIVGFVRCGP